MIKKERIEIRHDPAYIFIWLTETAVLVLFMLQSLSPTSGDQTTDSRVRNTMIFLLIKVGGNIIEAHVKHENYYVN